MRNHIRVIPTTASERRSWQRASAGCDRFPAPIAIAKTMTDKIKLQDGSGFLVPSPVADEISAAIRDAGFASTVKLPSANPDRTQHSRG